MAYLIGVILAVVVGGTASHLRLDRDRAFYPTVLIVIASYYALFAVTGGTGRALAIGVTVIAGFLVVSGVGFRRSLWVVIAGLVAHGVFDALHDQLITNPGVPSVVAPVLPHVRCCGGGVSGAGLLLRRAVPAHAL